MMLRKTIHWALSLVISGLIFCFPVELKAFGLPQDDIGDVIKKVSPSVVKVEARNSTRRVATGVVIDNEGRIVTTALISPRDEKITVTTTDGKHGEAKFLGFDTETHLALIQTKDIKIFPISLAKGDRVSPGAWVGVVGISPENTVAVTQGIVSSVTDDSLRLNVWVVPGSSGSPVVNKAGQMIGLLRGAYTDDRPVVFEFREKEFVGSGYVFSRAEAPASGMAGAIPVDIVVSVAAAIKEKGRVERGWLGLSFTEDENGRVEVVEVEPQSPANLAGLKEGDVILELEGKEVKSGPMLTSEIRRRKPGASVNLKVERSGKVLEIKAKLGERPVEEDRRELARRFPRLFPETPQLPGITPEKPGVPDLRRKFRDFWRWEKRKYIGVYLEELNRELSEHFGLKEGVGLLVSGFSDDSPAKKAGLKVGDVIFRVDGKKVERIGELSDIIADRKKGEKIKVEFMRDKKAASLEVEVAEEESRNFIPGGEWDEYLDSLRSYEGLQKQMKEWQDQNAGKLLEQSRRLAEEMAESYKKSLESLQKSRSQDKALTRIRSSSRNYYHI